VRHGFIPLLTHRTTQRMAKSLYSVSSIEEVCASYRQCIGEVACSSKKRSRSWNKSPLEQKSEQVLSSKIKDLRSSVPAFQLNSKMCRVNQKYSVRFALPASVIEENQNPYRTPKQKMFLANTSQNRWNAGTYP
jgi:hypothetical protein